MRSSMVRRLIVVGAILALPVTNAATEVPQDCQGFFQVYIDGQQVTQLICCSQQQARYSRDAIEFGGTGDGKQGG